MQFVYLFFLLFIVSHFSMAQDLSVDKEIQAIDSLLYYNHVDAAQKKTDSLHDLLDNFRHQKKYKSQLLELTFRQALILNEKEKSPAVVLEILQKITNKVETSHLHSLSFRIHLLSALSHEKVGNRELTDKYLKEAHQVYKKHKLDLDSLYSSYCIRRSSYYRWSGNVDSILYYAKEANIYAQKYGNEKDLADSYILLGNGVLIDRNYTEALEYSQQLLNHKRKIDPDHISMVFSNISLIYFMMEDFHQALKYSDSAKIFNNPSPGNDAHLAKIRHEIFENLGNKDSAYYYLKQYIHNYNLLNEEDDKVRIKELEEQYENDKKEAVIKSKEQQLFFIGSLLAVIVFGSVVLFRKNRQINKQNRIINTQLGELTKTLQQKQMLLSELQHRVKNNLQHVISILEIQKESVDFNNIDELIRGNQNRIHSMALLHKKLNVSDHVHEVDLKRYVAELSELVKDSYVSHSKKVNLFVNVGIEKISLEKALPLGLIIVELVSNSMKHAFKKQSIGIITIELTKEANGHILYYSDNGSGFDFNAVSEKGLGQEIIKGLIDQLDGVTETKSDNGFELTVWF